MISTSTILAVDLGKFKSVFCRFDPATFRAVPTTPEAARAEFERQPGVTVVLDQSLKRGRRERVVRREHAPI